MKREVPQPSPIKPVRSPRYLGRYTRRVEFRRSRQTRGLGDMSRVFQHHYLAAGRLYHFQMNLLVAQTSLPLPLERPTMPPTAPGGGPRWQ